MNNKIEVSIVSPMYNEEDNIQNTVREIQEVMESYHGDWELVLVNDGSIDKTLELAQDISRRDPRIRVISYTPNMGRGRALRSGFASARGDIIVTIESDLSWHASHILKIVRELEKDKSIDIILGSPYVSGGRTENVPLKRLLISRLGNRILGFVMKGNLKMVTQMLRGYRREVIDSLDLESEGKEIHLEIISKALACGYRVKEIPATLKGRPGGRSKFKFKATVISHLLFSFYEKPMMVFGFLGLSLFFIGVATGIYIIFLWRHGTLNPDRPLIILMLLLILGGIQIASFGVMATLLTILKKEIYKTQKEIRLLVRRIEEKQRIILGKGTEKN